MKMAMGCLAGLLAFSALADGPVISDVVVRQRWPWSRLVDINYVLDSDITQHVDVAVAAFDSGGPLTLPAGSLSGDLYSVAPGAGRIVWDPAKSAYTNDVLTPFRVSLTPVPASLYMIVDLATTQIVYVTESDLASGAWGSVQTNPVTGVSSVIWTGVTNNSDYMTTKMVFRRIPAGQYMMGGIKSVTLTKDFYAGVFEVTLAQWDNIMGASSSTVTPVYSKSYNTIRGSSAGANWPSNHAVDASSFIGQLRERIGVTWFDLPTDAQWEYLCRAGTTSYYYDGVSTSSADIAILSTLAWWSGNRIGSRHPVGEKLPNAWGLYDTIGNEAEWCLDWYDTSGLLIGGADPVGPTSGTARVFRGGFYSVQAIQAHCAYRWNVGPTSIADILGFRLIVNLPR